jgi:hypothetical protein
LQHDDSGLCFEALEQSYATQPQEEIEAAFNDLFTELLLILTRLLDRKTAQCLVADLAVKDVPRRTRGQGPPLRTSAADERTRLDREAT